MTSYKKYSEIANYKKNSAIKAIQIVGNDIDWIVEEKVHGCNFSFCIDNSKKIQVFKRNGPIESHENFYNWQMILEENKQYVLKLYEIMKEMEQFQKCETITIFGELAGGEYKHEEVKKMENQKKVQKEIDYCPKNFFVAFDIYVGKYLDYDLAFSLLNSSGFLVFKPLLRAKTLKEAFEFNHEFQTTVPNYFELPPINNNLSEGIVIKPVITKFSHFGERIIFKKKREDFMETNPKQKKYQKSFEGLSITSGSEDLNILLESIDDMLTKTRLQNAISKITERENAKEYHSQIVKEFTSDILKEIETENPENFGAISPLEMKTLKSSIGQKSNKFISPLLEEMKE